jgi:hypothetical protein
MFNPSPKYDELVALYAQMARDGYDRQRGGRIGPGEAYGDQEAAKFRNELKTLFDQHGVRSVLDYGGGGTDWRSKQVPEGGSLADYVGISDYMVFEPARTIDERNRADAVVCFDVMEHIYLADVGYVLNELFSHAAKLVVLNVAGYPANALLPTGENAHITVRPAQWWQGAVDVVASAYPEVTVALYHSEGYTKASKFPPFRFSDINAGDGYVR